MILLIPIALGLHALEFATFDMFFRLSGSSCLSFHKVPSVAGPRYHQFQVSERIRQVWMCSAYGKKMNESLVIGRESSVSLVTGL